MAVRLRSSSALAVIAQKGLGIPQLQSIGREPVIFRHNDTRGGRHAVDSRPEGCRAMKRAVRSMIEPAGLNVRVHNDKNEVDRIFRPAPLSPPVILRWP